MHKEMGHLRGFSSSAAPSTCFLSISSKTGRTELLLSRNSDICLQHALVCVFVVAKGKLHARTWVCLYKCVCSLIRENLPKYDSSRDRLCLKSITARQVLPSLPTCFDYLNKIQKTVNQGVQISH